MSEQNKKALPNDLFDK